MRRLAGDVYSVRLLAGSSSALVGCRFVRSIGPYSDQKPRMHGTQVRRAFVGGDASPADEYHDSDFSWEVHMRHLSPKRPCTGALRLAVDGIVYIIRFVLVHFIVRCSREASEVLAFAKRLAGAPARGRRARLVSRRRR